MGLQISEIIPKREITFQELKGKTLAVDAFNSIYQFLTTIRQPDGTPLKDSKGNVTSHLSGLFYRNVSLLSEGIKLIYVFDGKPPELKDKTREKRIEVKKEMHEKYEKALKERDVDAMGKYSRAETSLDNQKIQESKELLESMGIAVIQAPGEGEAQASYLAKEKDIYGVSSQDYDCLMFEAPKLIQNLTLARRRKTSSGVFKEVHPQLISLNSVLKELNLSQEQLICLGIICGTDYNPGGIKGLGPKKSLKIVQEFKTKEKIFGALQEDERFKEKYKMDFEWEIIYDEIKNPNIDKNPKIIFPKIDADRIKDIMLRYEFSEERIDTQLEKLDNIRKQASQRTLF